MYIFFLNLNNQSTFPKCRAIMHSNDEISTRVSGFATNDIGFWQVDLFFFKLQENNES